MLHPRLTGVLRTIHPTLPSGASPREAWEMIRPSQRPYLKNSFWYVLGEKLPYARSAYKQTRLAEWIWEQKERAAKAGQAFPPKPIELKPAAPLPQPRI